MTTASPKRAIAYIRVSTEQQAESGLGLEAQQSAVAAAAARLSVELHKSFIDAGTSGSLSIEERPVLLDAVAALKRGDVLLVAKRDRLGRDVIAVAMIERLIAKRGARVVSAAGEGTDSDDPAGLLMRRLIDSFAEYERLIISARTKAALRAKRSRGERTSRFAPFGYSVSADGKRLEPSEAEQAVLKRVRGLRSSGLTLSRIADVLNAEGLRTRRGTPWRHEYVWNVLQEQPAA